MWSSGYHGAIHSEAVVRQLSGCHQLEVVVRQSSDDCQVRQSYVFVKIDYHQKSIVQPFPQNDHFSLLKWPF